MKYFPLFAFCLFASSAFADDQSHVKPTGDLMPAKTKDIKMSETAPAIHISMDKSELIRLDQNAASVIVGNPNHAAVLMDSPNLLVVVPRAPGATYFSVLNQNGDVILQRHIIVGAPKENYIRVRSAYCGENNDCVKNESYYCETDGMCHEINSESDDKQSGAGQGRDNNAGNGNDAPPQENDLINGEQP